MTDKNVFGAGGNIVQLDGSKRSIIKSANKQFV
jgi:hypothetical protein